MFPAIIAAIQSIAPTLLTSIGTGVGAGVVTAFKKKGKGEAFSPRKLTRTAGISLVVGGIAWATGFELTADNYEAFIAANAGVISVAENLLHWAARTLKNRIQGEAA